MMATHSRGAAWFRTISLLRGWGEVGGLFLAGFGEVESGGHTVIFLEDGG